jgi:hypothetical protein
MRPLALLLALSICLAAGFALEGRPGVAVAAETDAPAPKRPPQRPPVARPAPIPAVKVSRLASAPIAPNALASSITADSDQCRLGCAHAYYFCLAGDDSGSCSGPWTSCLSDCAHAAATP